MTQRVRAKIASQQANIVGGTFHSIAYRFIRQECCPKGLLPEFKVLPEHHAIRLRKEAMERFHTQQPGRVALLRELSIHGADLVELYERKVKLNLQELFGRAPAKKSASERRNCSDYAEQASLLFDQLKQEYQVFDFNDLLYKFLWVLQVSERSPGSPAASLPPHLRRRIPGHKQRPGVDHQATGHAGVLSDGGGRRHAVHLFVPGVGGREDPASFAEDFLRGRGRGLERELPEQPARGRLRQRHQRHLLRRLHQDADQPGATE